MGGVLRTELIWLDQADVETRGEGVVAAGQDRSGQTQCGEDHSGGVHDQWCRWGKDMMRADMEEGE